MNLESGPEYAQLRADVAAFLAQAWKPAASKDALAIAAFRAAAVAKGLLYRSIPKRFGGSEQPADPMRARIIREEFAKVGAPREVPGQGVAMLVPTLLARGEEWQQEQFIPKTLSGEYLWCQGYSEPGAGSDLAALRTRGVLEGDEWVITGQKVWTTEAHIAHYMFLLVRTEPQAPKRQGISYLLMDMRQAGVTVRPLRQMTGGREFNEVFLDGARTPKTWIVGKRGEGWSVSKATLKFERDTIGGIATTEHQLASLLQLARAAIRNGRSMISRDDVRQQLARIEAYVMAQKYSSYRQMSLNIAGKDAGIIELLGKLNGVKIAHRIAALSQDLIGADGLAMPPQQRRAEGGRRQSKWINQNMGSLAMAIAGGTSNIQRNLIAERGLGMPRDSQGGIGVKFMLSEEQEQWFEAVLRYAKNFGQAGLRRAFDGDSDLDLEYWRGLMNLGAGAVGIPAAYGGAGLEIMDLALTAEALGVAAAPGPFLGHVLAGLAITRCRDESLKSQWLPRLASGEIIAAIVLEAPDPQRWTLRLDDGHLTGRARDVLGGSVAQVFVVGLAGGRFALIEKGAHVAATAIDSADRTRRLADVDFLNSPAVLLASETADSQAIVDAALVLVAADAFGGASRCLEMSAEYARTRVQFGRPIGSFQGLKFQLAEMAIEVEPARGLYWYAAHAFDHAPLECSRIAATAKAHLSEVYMQAARDTIEIHGGIGYTWDHEAQIYFKRAMFDYAWLGTPAEHRDRQATLAGW